MVARAPARPAEAPLAGATAAGSDPPSKFHSARVAPGVPVDEHAAELKVKKPTVVAASALVQPLEHMNPAGSTHGLVHVLPHTVVLTGALAPEMAPPVHSAPPGQAAQAPVPGLKNPGAQPAPTTSVSSTVIVLGVASVDTNATQKAAVLSVTAWEMSSGPTLASEVVTPTVVSTLPAVAKPSAEYWSDSEVATVDDMMEATDGDT